ncbi:hypothetical protein C9374_007110 [Naegleria lovaniensis]|uniref:Nudix hydrolase domain-containing protein n=1 Tax=Naegleria lovaniensis TaxID=51637 RepID=A0AA88KSD4_NAELO|nr:uncharacterized protein C9374_007110 [Naegleria lovaniensis]KAG2393579.1 hypothetical protein C9374_007110 [Naegleria lovaniensis]
MKHSNTQKKKSHSQQPSRSSSLTSQSCTTISSNTSTATEKSTTSRTADPDDSSFVVAPLSSNHNINNNDPTSTWMINSPSTASSSHKSQVVVELSGHNPHPQHSSHNNHNNNHHHNSSSHHHSAQGSSSRLNSTSNNNRKKSKNSQSRLVVPSAAQTNNPSSSEQEKQQERPVQQRRNSKTTKLGGGGYQQQQQHHSSALNSSHKQLLRRVQTRITTEDYSQDIKYRDLETNEHYDLKLNMKRTVINNMLEISTEMNRRAQYLMKYIGFEIDKTCFYDTEVKKGYVLHEHIAEVKHELSQSQGKRVPKEMFVHYPNDPSRSVSMCDTDGMSKLLDHILHSYISNYMVCPKCKSVKTTNPIVVDNDQQQNILNEFKENYNEELTETQERQLIERLDDFTFFTIQCRDCGHIEKIENANTSDQFIKQIFQSRQRNMTKSLKQHHSNENISHQSEQVELGTNTDYYPPMYGYPPDQRPHYYYIPPYYPTSNVLPQTTTADVYHHQGSGGYYPQFYPNYYPYPYYVQPVYAIAQHAPSYINSNMSSVNGASSSSSHQPNTSSFGGGSSSFNSSGSSSGTIEFNPSYKAAGIIPYSIHDGKVYFLLGKENRGGKGDITVSNVSPPTTEKESPYNVAKKLLTWSEFGGKREKFDPSPLHTASREFLEETRGLFGDVLEKLASFQGKYFANGKYYVYMIELPFIDLEEDFANSTLVDNDHSRTEKARLSWIDADNLIHRLYVHSSKYYHENGLLKVSVNGSDHDEFLHPFALALFRFMKTEVLAIMEKAKMQSKQ